MTTLEEYWTAEKSPSRKRALRRCQDCDIKSWGVRCRPCTVKAMQPPLDPCTECASPMHRKSTPREERVPGSRFYGTKGLCSRCANRAARRAKGIVPRNPRGKAHGRAMRPVLPVPSSDSSPLTHDEKMQAACARSDADAWFPVKGTKADQAKRVCSACPIQARCLAVALAAPKQEEGIWGGTSQRERAKMLAERELVSA